MDVLEVSVPDFITKMKAEFIVEAVSMAVAAVWGHDEVRRRLRLCGPNADRGTCSCRVAIQDRVAGRDLLVLFVYFCFPVLVPVQTISILTKCYCTFAFLIEC